MTLGIRYKGRYPMVVERIYGPQVEGKKPMYCPACVYAQGRHIDECVKIQRKTLAGRIEQDLLANRRDI